MEQKKTFSELLKASLKSKDTEETVDIYFNRPVGLAIALVCKSLHIHPNAITVFSFSWEPPADGCCFIMTSGLICLAYCC